MRKINCTRIRYRGRKGPPAARTRESSVAPFPPGILYSARDEYAGISHQHGREYKKLAHFEVALINRIWRCIEDEEENFEAVCRRLIDNGDEAELRRFMCRAPTAFLLALAFFRFKTAMKPRLSQKELGEAFIQMVNDRAKNVTDHWRDPPEGTFE